MSRAPGVVAAVTAAAVASGLSWLAVDSPAQAASTMTVAADGSGQYRTVQAAINAVPANNSSPVTISIKAGTYREIVTIPKDKPHLTLRGTGSSPSAVVIVNNHSHNEYGTSGSATMFVDGHDSVLANLTVSNDYAETDADNQQAVALNLNADRSVLRNVRLLGDQDTFEASKNARAYVVDSYLEGTVDFIFGEGTIVIDRSTVHEKRASGATITAAKTPAGRNYGFLFYRSTITGTAAGQTYLGRPWGPDAQVLFRECTLSNAIKTSQPWTDMSGNSWQKARFREYKNTGAGATTNSNRKQLSDSEAANHTPAKYLAGPDGWNPLG